MKFESKNYQDLGAGWLRQHNLAALFMGIGLGKTPTTLTVHNENLNLGESRGALVVAPRRVATLTWPNEVEKWDHTDWMQVANLRTKDGWAAMEKGKAQLYLTNYEQLPKLVEQFTSKRRILPWDTVIFDESTRAKNPKSKRINAFRPSLARVDRRWALTGTPTPNSLMELYAQIRLLDDGARFGKSFDFFQRRFFYPTDYMEYDWEPFDGAEQIIYGMIKDIAISLRTSDYLKLPDTIVEDHEVELPTEAHAQYRELEKTLLLDIGKGDDIVIAESAATLVNKLLQVTGGAVYTASELRQPGEKTWVTIHDAKINALKKIAEHYRKLRMPILIGYNYKHEVQRILNAIPGCRVFEDTKQFLSDWNAGKIAACVGHPQSIGHGLNMQYGGSVVVWFSVPWSRELYDQFNGRVIRVNQTKQPRVHRIICPGTMDDAVVEVLRERDLKQGELLQVLTNYRKLKAS